MKRKACKDGKHRGDNPWNFTVLHKAVQERHVLAVADELADHLLVQSGVFPEPLGHLVVVQRAAEQALLLQELDSLLGLLVELLCAGDQQLGNGGVTEFKKRSSI